MIKYAKYGIGNRESKSQINTKSKPFTGFSFSFFMGLDP
jgi:hypothetical protein